MPSAPPLAPMWPWPGLPRRRCARRPSTPDRLSATSTPRPACCRARGSTSASPRQSPRSRCAFGRTSTSGPKDFAFSCDKRAAMHDRRMRVGDRARAVLASPERCALFIDIDGTLLGVAPTPDAVSVPAGLVRLLEDVVRGLGGAAAVLTGRRIADADRLFSPLDLIASGVHGTELRCQPGGPILTLAPPIPASVVQAMNNIA